MTEEHFEPSTEGMTEGHFEPSTEGMTDGDLEDVSTMQPSTEMCVDKMPGVCPMIASFGHCTAAGNEEMAKEYCKKSCNLC
ncbi:shTK domain protein [Oesophagostomum dentatum]|uniref:ShTK domain protein n=1 Tax=Oesophagostomum dentatum TaxID=61180 RepID=A0A0B1TJY7_OESDE|nr:shTK domain protein [Oesophagostomum dentatum]